MRSLPFVLLLRLALLVAVLASATMLIEYQNPGDPTFCGPASACAKVRASDLSRFFTGTLHISLPQVGLAASVLLLGASLLATSRLHHRLVAAGALAGAAFGAMLIADQAFKIGAFCPWCLGVDISVIVAAIAAIGVAITAPREESAAPPPWSGAGPNVAWACAAALAATMPILWARFAAVPAAPAPIAALQVPGKVTIVEFTDFECPYCRLLHPALAAAKATHGDRIHFTRKMVPLEFHAGALPAAKVYLCAPEDKREAVADALYTAPPEKLTAQGTIDAAVSVGVDREALARCVESSETKAALAKDKELYKSLEQGGVPLTYVGPRLVLGANMDKLARSLARELEPSSITLGLPWMFVLLALAGAGAGAVTWRAARRPTAEPTGQKPLPPEATA